MKTRKEQRKTQSAYGWQKLLGAVSITYLILELIATLLIIMMSFIGIKTMNVVSESMVPVYEVGDLILTTENYNGIAKGDIVIFEPKWFDKGSIVHRVQYIDDYLMITKGDNNKQDDPETEITDIKAEVIASIPKAGYFLNQTFVITSSIVAIILYFLSTLILRKEYWKPDKD